jgi:hypothetical protein
MSGSKWCRLTASNFALIIGIIEVLLKKFDIPFRRHCHLPSIKNTAHYHPAQICELAEQIAANGEVWAKTDDMLCIPMKSNSSEILPCHFVSLTKWQVRMELTKILGHSR